MRKVNLELLIYMMRTFSEVTYKWVAQDMQGIVLCTHPMKYDEEQCKWYCYKNHAKFTYLPIYTLDEFSGLHYRHCIQEIK